ncbi:MAG: sugar phosphate isomerase/epimerase [Ruminococcaceae bacterium]|nr:sugar phosphate isomerase/epimerase [Oscillospiraceae bacterium]
MLKISLINPKINHIHADREKYYRMYQETGIDGLDYSLYKFTEKNGYESDFFAMSAEEIIEKHLAKEKEELDRYGLAVCQTHSICPTWRYGDEEGNRRRLRDTVRCIELTAYLGSRYIVVHPVQDTLQLTPDEVRARNIELYGKLIEAAKKNDVIVCLENMWNTRNGNIFECTCEDPYETNYYIDTLNAMASEERFGFCFDVGHATLCGKNLKNTLITLGNRVKTLHVHDANKISDLHTIPYSQMGNGATPLTDWTGFLLGLRSIGYRGTINFEAHAAFEVFPEPTHKALLGLFRAIGEYFSNEITNA